MNETRQKTKQKNNQGSIQKKSNYEYWNIWTIMNKFTILYREFSQILIHWLKKIKTINITIYIYILGNIVEKTKDRLKPMTNRVWQSSSSTFDNLMNLSSSATSSLSEHSYVSSSNGCVCSFHTRQNSTSSNRIECKTCQKRKKLALPWTSYRIIMIVNLS